MEIPKSLYKRWIANFEKISRILDEKNVSEEERKDYVLVMLAKLYSRHSNMYLYSMFVLAKILSIVLEEGEDGVSIGV